VVHIVTAVILKVNAYVLLQRREVCCAASSWHTCLSLGMLLATWANPNSLCSFSVHSGLS